MAYAKLGTKAVGSIVKIKVNGAAKDFIIVHQGLPSSAYDASCNGTWLLMKDIYTASTFGNGNSYKDSSIHTYLNGTFYNLIDSEIRAAVKQVKIPYQNGSGNGCWGVNLNGTFNRWMSYNSISIRPAMILPSTLLVLDDDTLIVNSTPVINASSTNLGEQNAPFNFNYTVTDADGDTLTVTEKLDGKTTKTRTNVASGTALTFEQASTAENFRRILNGSHTIQITVSDGKESTSVNATFTKSITAATVTLTTPLAVEGDITVAVLQVTGSIPDDATFKVEVTNNANDAAPVWQDDTVEVQKGVNIVFANKTASAGAAFNFRVSVERGASGEGGYIEAVSGAFQ